MEDWKIYLEALKAERHGVLGYQLFLVSNYVGRAVNHLCVDPKRKL